MRSIRFFSWLSIGLSVSVRLRKSKINNSLQKSKPYVPTRRRKVCRGPLRGWQQNRRQEFGQSADEPGLDFKLNTLNYDLRYQASSGNGWETAMPAYLLLAPDGATASLQVLRFKACAVPGPCSLPHCSYRSIRWTHTSTGPRFGPIQALLRDIHPGHFRFPVTLHQA